VAAPIANTQRRHKCFDVMHRQLIETAVRLISEKGVEAVSIAALARAVDINRTTVYYHFETREMLIDAVRAWSAEQLAKAFNTDASQQERIAYITRFVLENPELIKLWIDDLISTGDIRTRYPQWDALVAAIRASFAAIDPDNPVDAEVYCVILLTGAIIGPRVFKNSVCRGADTDTVVRRFMGAWQRTLRKEGLLGSRGAAAGAGRRKAIG
jgi:AcrR family transcriptional regulator